MTWSMCGSKGFAAKALGLVVSMDQMVGGEFQKGLEMLNAVVAAKA
jgi:hypothetical protein